MEKNKLNIEIPNDVVLINNIFKQHNIKLFLVGGCVRDSILDIKPKDWDLVSEAKPSKVTEMFKGEDFVKNILLVGESFGVISLVTENDTFEIATFRSDGEYTNNRHPDSVTFGSIVEDYKRRDLTCNALFFDIDTNEIVDLVGGIKDLKNGVVRTVGNPEDRFGEDRLRILRAIRFAGRFGSELEPNVDAALRKDASLEGISPERIRDEFLKGIKTTKSVVHFLKLIDNYKLFDWIFKGLKVNKGFIEERDPAVLLAFLLRDNDPAVLGKVLNQLTYSAAEVKAITFLVAFQQFDNPDDVYIFKKQHMNSGVGEQQFKKFGDLINLNKKLLNTFVDFKLSVSGDDAQREMGVKAGPEMGNAIKKMEADNFKSML
jgi:tRNA nucleotidyltransferase/poly(A) polymerase